MIMQYALHMAWQWRQVSVRTWKVGRRNRCLKRHFRHQNLHYALYARRLLLMSGIEPNPGPDGSSASSAGDGDYMDQRDHHAPLAPARSPHQRRPLLTPSSHYQHVEDHDHLRRRAAWMRDQSGGFGFNPPYLHQEPVDDERHRHYTPSNAFLTFMTSFIDLPTCSWSDPRR
jgi:hypothetical protein